MRIAKNASPAVAIQQEDPAFREDVLVNDEVLTTTFPLAIANIALDVRSPLPLHEQICQAIRSAVWARELPPKTLLPTTRELAHHLGVARNTVVFAYARLTAEGLCVSNTRRGHAWRPTSGAIFLYRCGASVLEASARSSFDAPAYGTSMRDAPGIARIDRSTSVRTISLYSFGSVQYPRTKLGRRLADKFLGAPLTQHVGAATRTVSNRRRGVFTPGSRRALCDPSQMIAVSGLEGAFDLTARVSSIPAIRFKSRIPRWIRSKCLPCGVAICGRFQATHLAPTQSHVDGPPARLVYVSPSVSFPFGVTMSRARRRKFSKRREHRMRRVRKRHAFRVAL